MKKSIELTIEEANELILLLNDAIKAKGFEVAENALYFRNKINSAFQEKQESPIENKDK